MWQCSHCKWLLESKGVETAGFFYKAEVTLRAEIPSSNVRLNEARLKGRIYIYSLSGSSKRVPGFCWQHFSASCICMSSGTETRRFRCSLGAGRPNNQWWGTEHQMAKEETEPNQNLH